MAARGHRVIALDLPGFGASPMPPWEITIPAYGRLVDELCEQLEVGECTLVGNSMGGFVAAEVAIGEPEWIERLVLVSAAGISHAKMRREPVLAGARLSAAANPLLLRLDIRSMRRPGLRKLAFGGVMRHPEKLRRELLVEMIAPAVGADGFLAAVAGADRLRPDRPARADPGPDADRLGSRRPRRPGKRRGRLPPSASRAPSSSSSRTAATCR